MSRIENALGKISLESTRRKKAGLPQFEHPLVVLEINKLKKKLQKQRIAFFHALIKIGGKGTGSQILTAIENPEDCEPMTSLDVRYMAAYLLENNKIRADIKGGVIVYSEGIMTDEEYIEFYKALIPIMEKKGVAVKSWVKEALAKGGDK